MCAARRVVPVLASSPGVAERLRHDARLCRTEVVVARTWPLFSELCQEADVCVVDPGGVPSGAGIARLHRLCAACPFLSVLVLIDLGGARLGALPEALPPRARTLVVPAEFDDFGGRVIRMRLEAWSRKVRQGIMDRTALPYVVRLALTHGLRIRPDLFSPGVAVRPRRSIQGVAEGIGVSRGHLSRLLSRHGVSLPELLDGWLVVQAATVRWCDDLPWERVAWRCGYASMSGLSDAFQRVAGARLRALDGREPEAWMGWFAGVVARAVGEGRSPGLAAAATHRAHGAKR